MKLLLLQPPIRDFYDTDIRLQPIGLGSLKAVVQERLSHWDVVIRDFHQGWPRQTIPVPSELSYLKAYYRYHDRSPFSSFYQYYHFGANYTEIAEAVAAESPDVVGISSLFTPYYREVLATAEAIRPLLSGPIIVGGSHVSAAPLSILQHEAVDYVITGEGERPLVEFLSAWERHDTVEQIANLGYKRNGECVLNPGGQAYPLAELPIPDYSDLPIDRYTFERRPLSIVVTSRSCPHKCSFCSVHLTFGHRYARRTPEDVYTEIRTRYAAGYRVFDFEDDNLTYYKRDMKRLCQLLIDGFPERDVEFVAMNGISYLSLDDELLVLMKRAGFTRLNLALVSSDKTVRETTKRPHTIKKYCQIVDSAVDLGFTITSYQILGLPNESLASMIQTLVFGAQQPVLLGASMFYLTPNSPIASGFPEMDDDDMFRSRLTAMAIETSDFCREDIYTLFVTTRILNFLKGIPFAGSHISVEELLDIAAAADKRSNIGARLLRRLLYEGRLFAATPQGDQELDRFRFDHFKTVWNAIEAIKNQQGQQITLSTIADGVVACAETQGAEA